MEKADDQSETSVEWFFDLQGSPFDELTNVVANSITQIAAAAVVIVYSMNELYREFRRFQSRKSFL